MQFYVYLNAVQRGPLDEGRVRALLHEGVLLGSDLAAHQPNGELRALSAFDCFKRTSVPMVTDPAAEPGIASLQTVRASSRPETVDVAVNIPGSFLQPLRRESLGPYARATLADDEVPFHKTSLHWIVFVRFAVMALLTFLFIVMPFAIGVQVLAGSQIGWFALPLPALMMLPPAFAFASSELVITDRRVLIKPGIVGRQTLELFIAGMESVGVKQDVLGRMFDYGTVTIRGMDGSEEAFEAIARPVEFRNAVQRLQSGTTPDGRG